jgi:hypothetical protein
MGNSMSLSTNNFSDQFSSRPNAMVRCPEIFVFIRAQLSPFHMTLAPLLSKYGFGIWKIYT